MNFDRAMRIADRENEELGKDRYSEPRAGYKPLEKTPMTVELKHNHD